MRISGFLRRARGKKYNIATGSVYEMNILAHAHHSHRSGSFVRDLIYRVFGFVLTVLVLLLSRLLVLQLMF